MKPKNLKEIEEEIKDILFDFWKEYKNARVSFITKDRDKAIEKAVNSLSQTIQDICSKFVGKELKRGVFKESLIIGYNQKRNEIIKIAQRYGWKE